MPQWVSAQFVVTAAGPSSYITTVTTQTSEPVVTQEPSTLPVQVAQYPRTWKAREIQRLVQLPLDTDDPAPAVVEALIIRLHKKTKDLPGEEDFVVTEEEEGVLREIQRCEGQG